MPRYVNFVDSFLQGKPKAFPFGVAKRGMRALSALSFQLYAIEDRGRFYVLITNPALPYRFILPQAITVVNM